MSTSNQLNWILYIVTNEQLVTNCDKSVILCFVTRINTESIKIQFWWQKSNFRRQKLNFRWRNGDFKFIWSFLVSGRGWNQGSMEHLVRAQAGPRFLKFFLLGFGPWIPCWNQIVFLLPNSAILYFWYFVANQSIPTNLLKNFIFFVSIGFPVNLSGLKWDEKTVKKTEHLYFGGEEVETMAV